MGIATDKKIVIPCTQKIVQSILSITNYLEYDESRSYTDNPSSDHIYLDVKRVIDWMQNEEFGAAYIKGDLVK